MPEVADAKMESIGKPGDEGTTKVGFMASFLPRFLIKIRVIDY
jgi:hypothetical protein